MDRPEWNKLYGKAKSGDTIVFDSVSRMSRNADEGIQTYFELYEKGIQLVFLKEKYINTEIYTENLKDKIKLQGTDEDEIFKGLNNYFRKLAEKQIINVAFRNKDQNVKKVWSNIPIRNEHPTPEDVIPYLLSQLKTSQGESVVTIKAK